MITVVSHDRGYAELYLKGRVSPYAMKHVTSYSWATHDLRGDVIVVGRPHADLLGCLRRMEQFGQVKLKYL